MQVITAWISNQNQHNIVNPIIIHTLDTCFWYTIPEIDLMLDIW